MGSRSLGARINEGTDSDGCDGGRSSKRKSRSPRSSKASAKIVETDELLSNVLEKVTKDVGMSYSSSRGTSWSCGSGGSKLSVSEGWWGASEARSKRPEGKLVHEEEVEHSASPDIEELGDRRNRGLQYLGLLRDLLDLLYFGFVVGRLWQAVKPLVEVCDRTAMYASGVNVNVIWEK
jgi:hypothetical protein